MELLGVEGEAEAVKIASKHRSPRYNKLDQLERFVSTTQYDGRPGWYDDSVPLWERKPCVAYPVVQAAIASNVDLLLGEQSFPTVTAFSHVNDDEELEDETLAEQLEWVDRGIGELIQKTRLKAASREAYAHAQGSRTAVSVFGARKGRLFIDSLKAKWCTPELDTDGTVLSVDIRYPYIDRQKDAEGKWKAVCKLYRRVIDGSRDVTFKPVLAPEDGQEPKGWTEDSALSVTHGLGFCPVVWYAYRKGCSTVDEIDGKAIHEHCLDEIEAHDLAISQRHSAALFVGQPQICEFGVPPGYNPTEEGGKPDLLTSIGGGNMLPNGAIQQGDRTTGRWVTGRPGGGARKKGPGYVWQYPDKQSCDVQLLELSGDALKALDEHARDLRTKISESMQVVFLDPENVKFAATVSGKALRTLRERQYSHCDQDREDFGEGWMLPALKMCLRIVAKIGPEKVQLRFARELFKALDALKSSDTMQGESRPYERGESVDDSDIPDLDLKWPDHFMPGPQEELFTVQAVMAAASEVPQRYRLQKLASIFDIDNVNVAIEELNEEKEAKAQADIEQQHGLMQALSDGAGPAAQRPPGSGAPNKKPSAGSRSSVGSVAT